MIEEFPKVNELPQAQEELKTKEGTWRELGTILEELPISLSLIMSLMYYEVSLVEIKLFLESYLSHDSLLHSGSMFDPSCHDFRFRNNASIESIVVDFGLDGPLFDILHGYIVSFQGFQVGANMVQSIQDWLISKSAFEEKSFYGLAIFYRKYIKDFSTIANSVMDAPEKRPDSFGKFVYLFLNYVLSLDQKKKKEFVKHIHFRTHDAIDFNNMKFELKRLVFDPGRWDWSHFRSNRFPSLYKTKLNAHSDEPLQILGCSNTFILNFRLNFMFVLPSIFDMSLFDGDEDSRMHLFNRGADDTVGLTPTVAGRLMDGKSFEGHTLPHPIGERKLCVKPRGNGGDPWHYIKPGKKEDKSSSQGASSSKSSAKKAQVATPPPPPLMAKNALKKHFNNENGELRMVELIGKAIMAEKRVS
ncbi:hypothetical protein M9H77_17052 [Catharanthus roseus]|uniref:Uncharacterized protein n=1 Tax=Catharanthus roseus TaxID=4058 RepID=A0ACC0B3I2_CATRO|nr:hypothetical protein M9H77_17052 [Catharanthus roseus]